MVAIESDREFGLSVLQRVDDELKRRGDLFRKLGVQDIAGYKRAGGTEPIPRSLLIIDEFQEFFVEDDQISQTASLLLDRSCGRAAPSASTCCSARRRWAAPTPSPAPRSARWSSASPSSATRRTPT